MSTGDPFVSYPNEGTVGMIVIGADTHKVTHTVGAVSEATGRVVGELTVRAQRRSFEDLLVWARGLDDQDRVWAIEDCRHVSGALERFLLARGERVVRVPPKLMADARKGARERGKSDAIDAVAIARAAIREGLETLPAAQLAGPELEVRLLVDHRERLVAQRTALINDLRWNLHDLWPELEIPPRAMIQRNWQDRVDGRLKRAEQTARVRIARDELRRIRELTRAIASLESELAPLVAALAPGLIAEPGCGALTAAKLIGEIAGVGRFSTDAQLARAAGVAPVPASSGNTRPTPPRPRRQPPTQLRIASPGHLQGPPRPRRRRLPRSQTGRGQDLARSDPLPQAPPRPPHHADPHAAAPPTTPLGDRPPIIARRGRMIHCNTPAGTPALT